MPALPANKIEEDVTVNSGNLPLSSNDPVTIYVSVVPVGLDSLPAFSTDKVTCYTGGIAWNNLPNQTLTITFQWTDSNIQDLSTTAPNLSFGAVSGSQQTCTVQANCCGNELFTVDIAQGGSKNAFFVITPAASAGNLQLPSQSPVDVYLSFQSDIPAFSLSASSGPYYCGGIAWNEASQTLTVNFTWTGTLISKLSGSSSNLLFGTPSVSEQVYTQTCTVQSTGGNDGFTVNLTNGGRHDPIIVVTPINN